MKPGRRIQPEKLFHSKWTAATPVHREKHFLVVELVRDEAERVQAVILEAVINGNRYQVDYRDLEDKESWHVGWL